MKLEIRILAAADLDSAERILSDAFETTYNRKLDLAFLLELQPDGRFLALADGRPVGMVGAVDYGPFAYIGTMGVLRAWQSRGIGRRLMEHLLVWLDERQSPIAVLDATVPGARLYRKLGFVADEQTVVWKMQSNERQSVPDHVRVVRETDITALARFDAPVFGAPRTAILRGYLSRYPGRMFIVENQAESIAGYILAQPRALGPWVARRPEDAEALLAAALSLAFEQAPRVLVPSTNRDAARILPRHGFQADDELHLHMRRGGSMSPGERGSLYALASFAIG